MTMNRLTIDLRPETYKRFIDTFSWGMRGMVVRIVVEELLNLCERYGPGKVVGALLEHSLHVKDFIKIQEENKDGNDN